MSDVERRKKETDVAIELANLYHQNGQHDQETSTLEAVFNEHGEYVDAMVVYNLSLAYSERQDREKLMNMIAYGREHFPAHLRFSRLMAQTLLDEGRKEDAIKEYEELEKSYGVTEDDILKLIALYEEEGERENDIKRLLESAIERGFLTKAILTKIIEVDSKNEEYKLLLNNII